MKIADEETYQEPVHCCGIVSLQRLSVRVPFVVLLGKHTTVRQVDPPSHPVTPRHPLTPPQGTFTLTLRYLWTWATSQPSLTAAAPTAAARAHRMVQGEIGGN
jgi:hypothetical protein